MPRFKCWHRLPVETKKCPGFTARPGIIVIRAYVISTCASHCDLVIVFPMQALPIMWMCFYSVPSWHFIKKSFTPSAAGDSMYIHAMPTVSLGNCLNTQRLVTKESITSSTYLTCLPFTLIIRNILLFYIAISNVNNIIVIIMSVIIITPSILTALFRNRKKRKSGQVRSQGL